MTAEIWDLSTKLYPALQSMDECHSAQVWEVRGEPEQYKQILCVWNMSKPDHFNRTYISFSSFFNLFWFLFSVTLIQVEFYILIQCYSDCRLLQRARTFLEYFTGIPPNTVSKMRCKIFQHLGCHAFT